MHGIGMEALIHNGRDQLVGAPDTRGHRVLDGGSGHSRRGHQQQGTPEREQGRETESHCVSNRLVTIVN